jgi:hypothetical protein
MAGKTPSKLKVCESPPNGTYRVNCPTATPVRCGRAKQRGVPPGQSEIANVALRLVGRADSGTDRRKFFMKVLGFSQEAL